MQILPRYWQADEFLVVVLKVKVAFFKTKATEEENPVLGELKFLIPAEKLQMMNHREIQKRVDVVRDLI